MKKEKKGKAGKQNMEAAAAVPILRIRNKFNNEEKNFKWGWGKKAHVAFNQGGNHHDEPNFNFSKYDYFFPIPMVDFTGKVLFFAGTEFSHYIEIIQDHGLGNGIMFKIGEITNFLFSPATPDGSLIVRTQDTEGEIEPIPFKISNTVNKDVEVKSVYDDRSLTFSWKINGASQQPIIIAPVPDPQFHLIKRAFTKNESMEFWTDAPKPFRVTIIFSDRTPAIAAIVRDQGIELILHRNSHIPETINITIQPDIP